VGSNPTGGTTESRHRVVRAQQCENIDWIAALRPRFVRRLGGGSTVRWYQKDRDLASIAQLWHAALAPTWPVLPRALDRIRDGLVAEVDGAAVGFVGVNPAGSIPLLLVHPDHQRRGHGTELLAAALAELARSGATRAQIGSGGPGYIWPGAPLDLPAGIAFLARSGFTNPTGDTMDLTQSLTGYRSPADAYDRPVAAGVTLSVATPDTIPEVLAFEEAVFPNWARSFDGGGGDILLARDRTGTIVGSLLFSTDPGSYAPMLGARAGCIGCVGVAPEHNGQGIGTAMVARASELLRDRGTRTCLVDWVVRDAFYGRVGYQPWRHYRMFSRSL
jgi:beta-N-acetylhexosaminidase